LCSNCFKLIQLATASSGNPIQLQVGSLRLQGVWGVLTPFDHLKTVHLNKPRSLPIIKGFTAAARVDGFTTAPVSRESESSTVVLQPTKQKSRLTSTKCDLLLGVVGLH
jgi:hypothetical protein